MKSYYGRPIGNHQRSFERYHLRPLTASSSPRLGFATPKTSIAIISGTGKASSYGLQIWLVDLHSQRPSEQKSIPNFGEKGVWAFVVTVQIFCTHSHERLKLRTSNVVHTFIGSSEQNPIKKFRKSSRGRTQGLSKFFKAPYIGATCGLLCDSSAFLF